MSTPPRRILPRVLTNGSRLRAARPAHASPAANITSYLLFKKLKEEKKNYPREIVAEESSKQFARVLVGCDIFVSSGCETKSFFFLTSWILSSFILFFSPIVVIITLFADASRRILYLEK